MARKLELGGCLEGVWRVSVVCVEVVRNLSFKCLDGLLKMPHRCLLSLEEGLSGWYEKGVATWTSKLFGPIHFGPEI